MILIFTKDLIWGYFAAIIASFQNEAEFLKDF
jgi:hypothetical protein